MNDAIRNVAQTLVDHANAINQHAAKFSQVNALLLGLIVWNVLLTFAIYFLLRKVWRELSATRQIDRKFKPGIYSEFEDFARKQFRGPAPAAKIAGDMDPKNTTSRRTTPFQVSGDPTASFSNQPNQPDQP